MMRPGGWGQGKNFTLFMFNNVPGDADDPEYRNLRLTGNVRYEIDFRAAVGQNITVDKLPTVPKTGVLSDAYIVNTDPEG